MSNQDVHTVILVPKLTKRSRRQGLHTDTVIKNFWTLPVPNRLLQNTKMNFFCWLFNSKTPNRIWEIVFREKLADRKNHERKQIDEHGKIVNKNKKRRTWEISPKGRILGNFSGGFKNHHKDLKIFLRGFLQNCLKTKPPPIGWFIVVTESILGRYYYL